MIEAVQFLTSVGQALASMRFYHDGHPARERAIDNAFNEARDLLSRDHVPRFTFAEGEVVYHRLILHEMKDWEWAVRFEKAGIQRLELDDDLQPDDFRRFLHDAIGRLSGGDAWETVSRQFAPTSIRYGALGMRSGFQIELEQALQLAPAGKSLSLEHEVAAINWIHGEVEARRELPVLEAEVVVRALALAINRESQVVLPLIQLKEFDQYTTTHSCNVAVLATAFAEHLGLEPAVARALGVCGLLHDIGKVRIPRDILIKPGRLEPAEREIIEQHPVHGARILIERERNLDLAAVVSFEHHRWADGGGYPKKHNELGSHRASRIIQICDVFDALCTDRPYRGGMPPEVALAVIEAEKGSHFDPLLVQAFATLVRSSMIQFTPIDAKDEDHAATPSKPVQGQTGLADDAPDESRDDADDSLDPPIE